MFGLLSPWTLTALISFVISFYASARSLQLGLAVEVIAITSVAANLAAILGGILVFGEPIGSGAAGISARCSRSASSSPAPRLCQRRCASPPTVPHSKQLPPRPLLSPVSMSRYGTCGLAPIRVEIVCM